MYIWEALAKRKLEGTVLSEVDYQALWQIKQVAEYNERDDVTTCKTFLAFSSRSNTRVTESVTLHQRFRATRLHQKVNI